MESNAVQGLLTSPTANLLLRKPVVHQCISEHFPTMKERKFTAGVELTTAAEVTASSPFLELFNVLFNARKEITQEKKTISIPGNNSNGDVGRENNYVPCRVNSTYGFGLQTSDLHRSRLLLVEPLIVSTGLQTNGLREMRLIVTYCCTKCR